MVEGDLYCLNAGSPTRFATPHSRATTVDITLSNSASFLAAHWETVDESWGSNHYPIRIEIAEAIRERLRFTGTRRVHTAKTDWERVRECFEARSGEREKVILDSSLDTQTKFATVLSLLRDCVQSHTPPPRRRGPGARTNTRANTWWDDECEKLLRLRRAAFLKYKQCSSFDNFISYKRANEIAKGTFRRKKRQSFLTSYESFNRTTNLRYVWQKVKTLNGSLNRKESTNSYSSASEVVVQRQIEDLYPPWCAPGPSVLCWILHRVNSYSLMRKLLRLSGRFQRSPLRDRTD
ncbi:uncharacterized protein LOC113563584 [Ooceraea biroi]|uniref:uncharacterized protein LOC113563584 n=1 Tax=Ooceraea biroi TaxID=2015173 RepID=UPI000F08E8C9|nr:uncharacterized protein LOC113563584 [Ooceraea biroi]